MGVEPGGALGRSIDMSAAFSSRYASLMEWCGSVCRRQKPYEGTGPASLALIGGEVQMGFNNVQTLLQSVQVGQLVALAVAEPKRLPALPDVPAVAETVPGFEMAPWVGIVAPARTPKEIVERLSQETLAIMHDPQVVKQLTEQQVTPFALSPDRFGELIGKDLEKWAGVIKTAGIKGE